MNGGCGAYRLLQPLQQRGACSRPMLPLAMPLNLSLSLPLTMPLSLPLALPLVHRPCPSPSPCA